MKTKDLMMGDWIQSPITPKPLKVAQINWDYSVECVGIDDMIRYHVGLGDIKPIPLTPEILEKNGFKPTGSQYIIYNDYYDILMFELSDSIWELQYTDFEFGISNAQISFSYVHQLQHVLRLCGIEKEIQL